VSKLPERGGREFSREWSAANWRSTDDLLSIWQTTKTEFYLKVLAMNGQQLRPRVTIVIEWENAQLAEQSRCLEMLRRLTQQIDEVYLASPQSGGFEVILLYDNEACLVDAIRQAVDPFFLPAKPYCVLRLEPTPGQSYFVQKNRGAELASTDVVVFIDSDVIPEDNWLAGLLSYFADPNIQFVCGNSYLSATNVYSKSFALFWFFPLRATKDVFESRQTFLANNFAVRRQIMLKYPFQPVPGTTRGWCRTLARRLKDNGIEIYYNSAARVSHPAPNGLSHFVQRALAQGRDDVFNRKARGHGELLRHFLKVAIQPVQATWKVLRNRRKVGLSIVQTPAAMAIAAGFFCLIIAGYLLALLAPGFAMRRWQI
jgi:glycosyltransferase involved in cell wall biosynthesis